MDNKTLETLTSLIRPVLARYSHQLPPHVGVDDLVQEVLLKVVEKGLEEMEDGYLRIVARNVALDAIASKNPASLPLDAAEDVPVEADALWQQRVWLESQMRNMGWDVEKLLRLKLKGLTQEQLAIEFGCSSREIRRREQAIIATLRARAIGED